MCTKNVEAEKRYMERKNKHLYKVDMGGPTIVGNENKLQSESTVPSLCQLPNVFMCFHRDAQIHTKLKPSLVGIFTFHSINAGFLHKPRDTNLAIKIQK